MTAESKRPAWATRIRQSYVSGETSVFILHLNVFDRILHDGSLRDLTDYLARVLLWENKRNILVYEPSIGVKIIRAEAEIKAIADLTIKKAPHQVLPLLEAILMSTDSTAVIIPYAEMLAPAGEVHFLSEQDRASIIALHRWSLSSELGRKDNVVFLQAEMLSEIHPKIVSNPRVTTIEVPLPNQEERVELVRFSDASIDEAQVQRLAERSAGLKAVQIAGLLTPKLATDLDEQERRSFIEGLLAREPNAKERAEKLSSLTRGMGRDAIQKLLRPSAEEKQAPPIDPQESVLKALTQRKREIIERECEGLIEFIEPKHDLSAVGGLDEIKEELRQIASAVRSGDRVRSPMGLLIVGPMGTGKTFIANAFVKESGLSAVRLKNFRSKWVGSTEANLEKVLNMVRALGPIALIVDEGDRALADEGESDGGTGSRVIARLKEFMSDPQNRGVVLVILMTNRPDKLDTDMKRAGRLDKKIPLFYADKAVDVEAILNAIFRRHGIVSQVDFEKERTRTSGRLIGYSNADIEAVVLLAHELATRNASSVTTDILAAAIDDYVPSRDSDMLEYMELLAAFEASRRTLLPERLRGLSSEELNQRLKEKRASIRA